MVMTSTRKKKRERMKAFVFKGTFSFSNEIRAREIQIERDETKGTTIQQGKEKIEIGKEWGVGRGETRLR